jgi:hypothetical protein
MLFSDQGGHCTQNLSSHNKCFQGIFMIRQAFRETAGQSIRVTGGKVKPIQEIDAQAGVKWIRVQQSEQIA